MDRALLINTRKAEPVRRLERMAGLSLAAITEPWNTHLYSASTEVHTVDDLTDLRRLRSLVMNIMKGGGLTGVVTPAERAVQAGGYIRSFFEIQGMPYEVANRFTNKAVMKRCLQTQGIDVAAYRLTYSVSGIPSAAQELGWPVVVKPALGTGAYHTFKIDSPRDFDRFCAKGFADVLERLDVPLLVEEFIDMDAEYHCDAVIHNNQPLFCAGSKYFMPLLDAVHEYTGSYFLPPGSRDGENIKDIHQRVVAALDLQSGVTHLELFKRSDRFIVGEIACRPGGGGTAKAIALQYGVDIWQAFFDISLGREPRCVVDERAAIIANCDLPLKAGRVRVISRTQDIEEVPGVIEAYMHYTTGDLIQSPYFDSAAAAGLALVEATTEEEVSERVRELSARFVLEVE